jgi:hypothetical protein
VTGVQDNRLNYAVFGAEIEMNHSLHHLRRWSLAIAASISIQPFLIGCGVAEEAKTPEQIEQIRLQHIEASQREMQES